MSRQQCTPEWINSLAQAKAMQADLEGLALALRMRLVACKQGRLARCRYDCRLMEKVLRTTRRTNSQKESRVSEDSGRTLSLNQFTSLADPRMPLPQPVLVLVQASTALAAN